jgi:ribonuclease Y
MDINTILYIVGGLILGIVLGYVIAKSLEKGKGLN